MKAKSTSSRPEGRAAKLESGLEQDQQQQEQHQALALAGVYTTRPAWPQQPQQLLSQPALGRAYSLHLLQTAKGTASKQAG
jgi:hypothetical protein